MYRCAVDSFILFFVFYFSQYAFFFQKWQQRHDVTKNIFQINTILNTICIPQITLKKMYHGYHSNIKQRKKKINVYCT